MTEDDGLGNAGRSFAPLEVDGQGRRDLDQVRARLRAGQSQAGTQPGADR